MSGKVIVTGAVSPQPVVRREIVELFSSAKPEDKAIIDLFLQALINLQHRDPNDPTSYFQIAGVHGKPYQPWDPHSDDLQDPDLWKEGENRWGGYCVHGDTLFPTWHRPYLAAFEQFLQAEAIKIAASYPENQRGLYQQAATNFRLPYWDWATAATAQTGLPQIISQDNVTINAPNGTTQIRNPLASYEFQVIPGDFTGDFAGYKRTLRRPDQSGNSNMADSSEQIKSNASALQLGVRNIFDVNEWLDFSNHRTTTGTTSNGISSHTSIENLHDSLHGLLGGAGHMGNPDYAAFDPVFFLHHCNVDRLFAIWQATYPTVFVQPFAEDGGTFTVRDGELQNQSSPLTPWRRSDTTYWSSDDCRDTKALNYSYPELEWKLDPGQLRAQMISLYGGKKLLREFVNTTTAAPTGGAAQPVDPSSASSGAPKASADANNPHAHHPIVASSHGSAAQAHPDAPQAYPATHQTTYQPKAPGTYIRVQNHLLQQFREWFALIDVRKNVYGGPFTIHVFIGDVPDDHSKWNSAPSHCGVVNIFARNNDTHCSKCRSDPEVIVGGTVDLTEVMLHQGIKLDLDGGATAARLKKDLKLRVFKYETREVIDAATIPTLTLRVQTAAVELEQIADDKIKDSGNGRATHRVPKRLNWVHVNEIDRN